MGWNRSSESGGANTPGSPHGALRSKGDGTARGKSPRPRWLRGAVAALIVVVGTVSVWWLLSPSPAHQTSNVKHQTSKPSRIADAQPTSVRNNKSAEATAPSVQAQPATNDEWSSGKYPGEKIISCTTNSSGFLVERTVDRNGRTTRHISTPPSPWKHSSDEMLANVLSTPLNAEMAPLPPIGKEMDAVFMKSLKEPIEENADDNEELKAMKAIVASAREEVLARMQKGEHFCDILADHRQLHNDNGKIRSDAVQELKEILGKGDQEGARHYLNRMNAAFSQMGITPISEEDTQPRRRHKQ